MSSRDSLKKRTSGILYKPGYKKLKEPEKVRSEDINVTGQQLKPVILQGE